MSTRVVRVVDRVDTIPERVFEFGLILPSGLAQPNLGKANQPGAGRSVAPFTGVWGRTPTLFWVGGWAKQGSSTLNVWSQTEQRKPKMAIKVLSRDVSSKIAAGEVIERPASVVKELVENSLDAGASRIVVEIKAGGTDLIRVTDDGCGIPGAEVELAFQRFATSKVSEVAELGAIATLGFRGEALPSVATVAGVTLATRTESENSGSRIELEDGELKDRQAHGGPVGTSISVRHLFRNFPARRRFLRSVATEVSRVQKVVTRYALAYPEVAFQLDVEGSTAFSSPGSGDVREAVSALYGLDVGTQLLEILSDQESENTPPVVVTGLISPPSVDRANRGYITFFTNRRWVQSRMLGYALEQAYQGFLMERRYPMAVVNIELPFDEVEVNVHPSKAEVRFRSEGGVFSALQQAVRRTLTIHSPVPQFRRGGTARRPGAAGLGVDPMPFFAASAGRTLATAVEAVDGAVHGGASVPSTADAPAPKTALPALRALGQVNATYIVAEGPDGLYLIDQHAAHERVLFERVREQARTRNPQVQSLLEPATVELDPAQGELVEGNAELIASFGFYLEPFGPLTYLLRGVPSLLDGGDPRQGFLDVLDLILEGGGFETLEERAAYSIACHAAIRAGKSLSQQEMSELARQLEQCDQPHTCPHGRPTMIHMSTGRLEREFGRV